MHNAWQESEGVDMTFRGLDHVQIAIPPDSEDTAREFYRDLLGLTEIPKPEPLRTSGGCWFRGPGLELHLGVQEDFVPSRKGHPAFLIAGLDNFRIALETAGVKVTPDDRMPGVSRFYAQDPFGNRLEFIEDSEGFSQREWSE